MGIFDNLWNGRKKKKGFEFARKFNAIITLLNGIDWELEKLFPSCKIKITKATRIYYLANYNNGLKKEKIAESEAVRLMKWIEEGRQITEDDINIDMDYTDERRIVQDKQHILSVVNDVRGEMAKCYQYLHKCITQINVGAERIEKNKKELQELWNEFQEYEKQKLDFDSHIKVHLGEADIQAITQRIQTVFDVNKLGQRAATFLSNDSRLVVPSFIIRANILSNYSKNFFVLVPYELK